MKIKYSHCKLIFVTTMPTSCEECQFNVEGEYCAGINDIRRGVIPAKGKNINCPLILVKSKKKK